MALGFHHRVAAVALLLLVCTATVTAAQSPSPSASLSAPAAACPTLEGVTLHEPSPPAGFDPSVIRWIGNQDGHHALSGVMDGPLWVTGIDGSSPRLVPTTGVVAARLVPEGSVVAIVRSHERLRLAAIAPDGSRRWLGIDPDDLHLAVDGLGRYAYVWRASRSRRDRRGELVRVALDGTSRPTVLASIPAPTELFVSPDGSSVVVTWRDGDQGPLWMEVRTTGQPPVRLRNIIPVGIDAAGRILGLDREGILQIDGTTVDRTAPPMAPSDRGNSLVTPSGTTFVRLTTDSNGTDVVSARTLATGERRNWRLPTDGRWSLTDLGGNRYVVLGQEAASTTVEWAVIDLEDGWLGFVPFCVDLMALSLATLPAPPASFDVAAIPYVGSRFGNPDTFGDLWYGRLDGSGLRPVPVEGNGIGTAVADGGVVVTAPGDSDAGNALVLVKADGSTTQLLEDHIGYLAVNLEGDVVYTLRADGADQGAPTSLWRVPLDGSKPTRVLRSEIGASYLAVSPDERSFAVGAGFESEPGPLFARFDLGRTEHSLAGFPQGFDSTGRLIFNGQRYDPSTGRTSVIHGMGRANGQSVTADGRTMLAQVHERVIRALDLVTGERRSWTLAPGDWYITDLSTSRYVVAARFPEWESERVDVFAVVDLRKGWLGYVPFHGPEEN